jgi:threonine aldolase
MQTAVPFADAAEREQIQRSCTRFFGHPPKTIREQLLEIAGAAEEDEYPDRYGGGDLLESFEREIAQLLGKEAAVFMPSGTMAQQIALRIHCERCKLRTVALHPQSHLLVSENGALTRLQGLQPIPAGDRNRLYALEDLCAIPERIGALLLELPERNIGGALRPWSEVEAIAQWAKDNGVGLHLDGARLWESQPYYGMPLADIAKPFDTVYVSFYKILGAVAGAALAGPRDVMDEARAWQWRHGGRLVQQYPMVVSARLGLQRYLPRVPQYCERARGRADTLGIRERQRHAESSAHKHDARVRARRSRTSARRSAANSAGNSRVDACGLEYNCDSRVDDVRIDLRRRLANHSGRRSARPIQPVVCILSLWR